MRCVFCRPQGQGALRICEDDGLHGGHSFIGVRLRLRVRVCMYAGIWGRGRRSPPLRGCAHSKTKAAHSFFTVAAGKGH